MSASVLAAPAVNKAASAPTAVQVKAASAVQSASATHVAVAAKATAVSQKDPFAGDTWHAVEGTWPGTFVFVGDKHEVTLSPVGAAPMKATYTYTVKPSAKDTVEGTLRMTNTANPSQVSESTFRIEGKTMNLMYADGQRPEQYVRMTTQEEEAEKARLQKMISEGRIRPLKQ